MSEVLVNRDYARENLIVALGMAMVTLGLGLIDMVHDLGVYPFLGVTLLFLAVAWAESIRLGL